MELTHLSDEELVKWLHVMCDKSCRLLARVLRYIGEVDRRRMYLQSPYPTLFEFCVRRLGMSDGEAHRRTEAARLARKFPDLFGYVERGEIRLSTVLLLRNHLTSDNCSVLLPLVARKTQFEVQELLAKLFPQPDVVSTIENLVELAARTGKKQKFVRSRYEPLSQGRYKVEFTASDRLREKLNRAVDILRHVNPTGDFAVVIERALDLLLEEIDPTTEGKAESPRVSRRATRRGYIARPTRRKVRARDGGQCTYVAPNGERCASRAFLQLDHIVPRAHGGSDEPDNLRTRCHAHHAMETESVFGREHVERKIAQRRAASARTGDAFESAMQGLVAMGFREADVRHVLDQMRGRNARATSVDAVVREALVSLK